jgi:hypothetical protein
VVRSAPSTGDLTTVLGGVKGSLAALGGSAALDPACAPRGLAVVDGDSEFQCPGRSDGPSLDRDRLQALVGTE